MTPSPPPGSAAERLTPAAVRASYPQAAVVTDSKEAMRRVLHERLGTSVRSESLLFRCLSSGGGRT